LAETNPKAAEYLDGVEKKHWVKFKFTASFQTPTYDELISNLVEQANSWIGNDLRSAKSLDAFSVYFRRLTGLSSDRRQMCVAWAASKGDKALVPVMQSKLNQPIRASKMCDFISSLGGSYSVQHLGPTRNGIMHPWRLVDLPVNDCTCGNWKDKEFSCVHAHAAPAAESQQLNTLYDREHVTGQELCSVTKRSRALCMRKL